MVRQAKHILLQIIVAAFCLTPACADDLTRLTFEQLLSLEITSVAKKPQLVEEAAAAVFVITQDDIKKTGANTIPELLRLAPGLEVGVIDASNTAVSARGFNWRFSSKLLVLVDGRAVYQSLWSGVLWDQQLIPVEDIDRIEVIRGPGATLYGANAVNGVINIVTKHAVDTLGGASALRGGIATNSTQGFGRFYARQGVRLGGRGALRLYVTGRDEPSLVDAAGVAFNKGARALQTGFRLDWEPNQLDAFTLQGDYQTLDFDVTLVAAPLFFDDTLFPDQDVPMSNFDRTTGERSEGYNILGRWTRAWAHGNTLTVQAYFDSTTRSEFDLATEVNTFDIDVSHHFSWADRFESVWGAGYRFVDDEAESFGNIDFQERAFNADLFSAFLQHDVYFFDKRLRISVGSKFEHNEFTGFEVQPSFRGIWIDDRGWSLWGAVSRAVRTPSRLETSIDADLGRLEADPLNGIPFPIELFLLGDENLEAEDLLAFEIGFRKKWGRRFVLDVTGYAHKYDDLLEVVTQPQQPIIEPVGPGGSLVPIRVDQPLLIQNGKKGDIHGFEAALQFNATNWWTLKFATDVKHLNYPVIEEGDSSLNLLFLGDSPGFTASLRSDFDISHDMTTTIWARRVGSLKQSNTNGYTDLDFRLGYRLSHYLELTLLGENLVSGIRREFPSELYPAPFGFVERKASLSISARF